MSIRAFNHTVSIITKKDNEKNYAATIAWMCQVGYEEVVGLMGSQSDTGNSLKIGDKVAVNVCSKEMKSLAALIGSTHSKDINKLAGVVCDTTGDYIIFPLNRVTLLCEVKNIMHLEGIEEDSLVYFKVLESSENKGLEFLQMSDMD